MTGFFFQRNHAGVTFAAAFQYKAVVAGIVVQPVKICHIAQRVDNDLAHDPVAAVGVKVELDRVVVPDGVCRLRSACLQFIHVRLIGFDPHIHISAVVKELDMRLCQRFFAGHTIDGEIAAERNSNIQHTAGLAAAGMFGHNDLFRTQNSAEQGCGKQQKYFTHTDSLTERSSAEIPTDNCFCR